ncbi:MAG: DUF2207 domain-containing protein [Gracilimonas sp.]|nr:DUF2207 domain-containing protein [Gracilimonas sp.]
MKKRKYYEFIKVYAYLLFVIGVLLPFSNLSAKDYSIPDIRIDVQVNADGTVTVTEHRTYVYDGSYTWANYRLPKIDYSAIRNISVSENGDPFINLNTEEPGSFLVEESEEAFNIKWFYRAEDETRTFSISYTIEGAVVVGPEWSEFFWTYAASGREKSTDTFEIMLQLPAAVPPSDLHHWVREPAWAIDATTFENGFQFKGTDISRSQAVTIRTLFPSSVFNSQVDITDPVFSLDTAEQEEFDLREQRRIAAEEDAKAQILAWEVLTIISGLSILIFIYFYRKYGSRHKVNLSSNQSILLPGREKPAAIGWLIHNRTVTHGLIMATLLDLARQGYLSLKENEADDDGWLASKESYFTLHPTESTPVGTLTEYEQNLLNFVLSRINEEGNKLEDIFKFSDSDVSKWFYKWKDELKDHCEAREWIDPESYKGMYWNLGLQTLLLAASTVGLFLIHPLMSIAMGVSFVMLILSLVIVRRTPKGEELYRRWKNYIKALQNAKEHSISEDLLGLHFIYSIAFGVGKQHIETMFEQNPQAATTLYWIVILPGSGSSPANVATSFSNLAATATSSASGGSFGGGATAGTAGGGASGGAG